MSEQTVVVKYQTQKHHCSSCNQKLPKAEMSKVREFEISKDGAMNWADWQSAAEFPEDIESMAPEFVYEIISFHATHSYEKIIIEDSEVERVKDFILSVVVSEVSHETP